MMPNWLQDTILEFGRTLGLEAFTVSHRGTAGVRFENGVGLFFEYATGRLVMRVVFEAQPTPDNVKRLLVEAHPQQRVRLRAGYLPHTGEFALVSILDEHEADVSAIGAAFRELWTRAEKVRSAI